MLWRLWICLVLLMTLFSSWMILQVKLPQDRVVWVEHSRVPLPDAQPLSLHSWRADSQVLATTNPQGQIQLWDRSTGQVLATLEHFQSETQQLAWQPQGTLLAAIAAANPDHPQSKQLALWDSAQLGQGLTSSPVLIEFDRPLYKLAWRPDGAQLAILTTHHLILWDVANRRIQHDLPLECAQIKLQWNPTGSLLALRSAEGCPMIFIVNPRTGAMVSSATSGSPAMTWLDSATLVAPIKRCDPCRTGGLSVIEVGFKIIYQDGQFLDPPAVHIIDRVTTHLHRDQLPLFFSSSRDLLILHAGKVYLWRLADGQLMSVIPHLYDLWLPMSLDNTFLPDITPSHIRLLDWQTPHFAWVVPNRGFVSWSPDSQQLAQMVDGVLIFWGRQEVCADWPDPLRDLLVRQRPWCE